MPCPQTATALTVARSIDADQIGDVPLSDRHRHYNGVAIPHAQKLHVGHTRSRVRLARFSRIKSIRLRSNGASEIAKQRNHDAEKRNTEPVELREQREHGQYHGAEKD